MQKAKFANTVIGKCAHCGKPQFMRQQYIVTAEVWAAAGMGWDYYGSGCLHRECLEQRIGRALVEDVDLLAWAVGIMPNGKVHMQTSPHGAALIRQMSGH